MRQKTLKVMAVFLSRLQRPPASFSASIESKSRDCVPSLCEYMSVILTTVSRILDRSARYLDAKEFLTTYSDLEVIER